MGISQRLFDLIPNTTISDKKLLSKLYKIGDVLGRPMPNRLIMGATALVSQPFIDRYNKRVDEDTAKASCCRTIGKIVAGTAVGCIVRGGVYELVQKCTDTDISTPRWNNLLTPRNVIKVSWKFLKNSMRNYRTALATILSLGIMLVTNVAIDMPLTNIISNKLSKLFKTKQPLPTQQVPQKQQEVADPTQRIKDRFKMSSGGIK